MEFELSDKTKNDIAFLDKLSLEEVINWPIDYEINKQTFSETSGPLGKTVLIFKLRLHQVN
jgi:hypothetical protein